jgi:hypothetical protein
VPAEYDFDRNDRGRYLNTKGNVQGRADPERHRSALQRDQEAYGDLGMPDSKFIHDMQDESALIEIEDRCIQMQIPQTKVRDYLKLLAVEYNPVMDWMESRPWDGQSRLQAFLDSITSADQVSERDADEEVVDQLRGGGL